MRNHLSRFVALAVLVTVVSQATAATFLIVHRDLSWANDMKSKIVGTGLIDAPDILLHDAATTPSVVDLSAHRAVVVYANGVPGDANALGDNLADYVDAGGGVVTMIFGYTAAYIGGRWQADNYSAFPYLGVSNYGANPDTLGTIYNPGDDPASQIFAGVNTLGQGNTATYEHNFPGVTAGAELLADWTSGRPLAALNLPAGSSYLSGYVVGLNMVVPSSDARADFGWDAATDGGRLFANALLFTVIPEPASLTVFAVGVVLVIGRRRRA